MTASIEEPKPVLLESPLALEAAVVSRSRAEEIAVANLQQPDLAPPEKQPKGVKVPEPVPKKIGWAVVGLGKLALEEVMPAFGACRLSKPTALVSGHPEKAQKTAVVYGVPSDSIYNYDDFDRLIENRNVDAVFIILPNNMHAEFTIRALNAGKHVLCEKPMATSVRECEEMIAAAKRANRKLMIAYRLRYEPFNQKVIELCQQGHLGKIKLISAGHSQVVDAPNIRLSGELGGGPMGDLGIYCLNAARYITGMEPIEVTALRHQPETNPLFREVAESVSFQLKFAGGAMAHASCSFNAAESRYYRIEGTEGGIELENAFAYFGQVLTVKSEKGDQQLKIEPVDHFAAEMDHFSECILHDKPPRTPGEEGLADMRVIEAIEESARTGMTVQLNNRSVG